LNPSNIPVFGPAVAVRHKSRWKPASRSSGGDQLYFNDPDGISVQLAQHGYLG
jgi:hypothetical protein